MRQRRSRIGSRYGESRRPGIGSGRRCHPVVVKLRAAVVRSGDGGEEERRDVLGRRRRSLVAPRRGSRPLKRVESKVRQHAVIIHAKRCRGCKAGVDSREPRSVGTAGPASLAVQLRVAEANKGTTKAIAAARLRLSRRRRCLLLRLRPLSLELSDTVRLLESLGLWQRARNLLLALGVRRKDDRKEAEAVVSAAAAAAAAASAAFAAVASRQLVKPLVKLLP